MFFSVCIILAENKQELYWNVEWPKLASLFLCGKISSNQNTVIKMNIKYFGFLGQFLMAEDVNQAALIAYNVRQLSAHDVTMLRKVIQENWEDEEQMVSNLLQFPHLIPEDIRMESLKRGLSDLECPYYILSAAVGLQRIPIDEQKWEQFLGVLKQACLHDVGMVSMRAFMTLQPKLKHPDDTTFITDILKRPKSTLFQNALTWLIMKVKEKSEIMTILQDSGIAAEAISKAEKIIDEQLKIKNNGKSKIQKIFEFHEGAIWIIYHSLRF